MSLEAFFGNSTLHKMIDFFLENRYWDYSKTDIARHIGLSRPPIYKALETLEKYDIVTPSRRLGNTTLYKTNLESPIVKEFSELSLKIAMHDED